MSLVLGDSEVTFLKDSVDAAFCRSVYCILFIYAVAKSNSKSSNFLAFHTLRSISSKPAAFLFLIFH